MCVCVSVYEHIIFIRNLRIGDVRDGLDCRLLMWAERGRADFQQPNDSTQFDMFGFHSSSAICSFHMFFRHLISFCTLGRKFSGSYSSIENKMNICLTKLMDLIYVPYLSFVVIVTSLFCSATHRTQLY